METRCPDSRLDYIVEGVKFEGATIKYETVAGEDPGWILHVFEPKVPDTAMIEWPVREAEIGDADRRLALRTGLDSQWFMCFWD